jgi:hypothetical protein
MIRQFSEWCAVLDYFERQWHVSVQHPTVPAQWIVWTGICEIPYGQVQAILISPTWTAGAMSYWKHRELASGWSMTHSRNTELVAISIPYYGRILARNQDGHRRFVLENRDLASHNNIIATTANVNDEELVLAQTALVPFAEAYEDEVTMALVAHSKAKPLAGMKCYWDTEEGEEGDWEDVVATLGEHAKRILAITDGEEEEESLESCLEKVYQDLEREHE